MAVVILLLSLCTVATTNAVKLKMKSTCKCDDVRLSALETELSSVKAELSSVKASTFIRWGKKNCPDETTLLYTGFAGGKSHSQKGSGTNILCLVQDPYFDDLKATSKVGRIYGAEYQNIPYTDDKDVPCSVCATPHSTTIMVPATQTCPAGWKVQYKGHLASNHYDFHATEYVCLNENPLGVKGGERNSNDGLLFHYVTAQCGSLHCPPYIANRVVTCVVCSH